MASRIPKATSEVLVNRYIPETHDPILTEMNEKWRRTDQEIADAMGLHIGTVSYHRSRLGLPRYTRPRPALVRQEEPAPAKERANPLRTADLWLGKRLVEKKGMYWLDGVPASLEKIMQATNRLLKAAGAEQIGYNSRWLV
jgi:hypothetical protein